MTDDATLSRRAFLRTAAGTSAAAGAAGTATAQEETTTGGGGGGGTGTDGGGTGTDGGGTGTDSGGGGGGGMSKTVIAGPEGELVFEPDSVKVTPGSTVTWVWESDNHNVVPESTPDGADWKGTDGPPSKTYDTGHEYSHTFDATGSYEYFCQPHKSAGMTGTVEVVENIETGGGPSVPQVPESAKTLGVATTFAMIATLGLAFFFLKYGGDYEVEE